MKKFYSAFFSLLLAQFLFAQIPNNDFELWDNQPVPLYWKTNSYPLTLPPYDPYIVKKDTERYSGNFAANLYGNGAFKAFATTTFPVNVHPLALSLYYKLSFAPCVNDSGYFEQDTVSVFVELLKNQVVVDSGYWQSKATNFDYSQLIVPVSQNAPLFDSCRITLRGGKVYGGCGFAAASTEFKVDHLQLLDSTNSNCNDTGVVVMGVECLLLSDWSTSTLLQPCNLPNGALLHEGDTIIYSYTPSSCASFCMQGNSVDVSCFQILHSHSSEGTSCQANFNFIKHIDSVEFYNSSFADSVTGYLWNFGDGDTSTLQNPTHVFAHDSSYIVCLHLYGLDSSGNNCVSDFCDTILITHNCIDSSLICPLGSLCCDAPLFDPVCGCDSVTYMNACVATLWGGVTGFYHGDCVTTGIKTISETERGIFVSPVPMKDWMTVSYSTEYSSLTKIRPGATEIRILNTLGEVITTAALGYQNSGLHKTEMDLSSLSPGIYFVEVRMGNEHRLRKIVKE